MKNLGLANSLENCISTIFTISQMMQMFLKHGNLQKIWLKISSALAHDKDYILMPIESKTLLIRFWAL
jgi:hypothetical protein